MSSVARNLSWTFVSRMAAQFTQIAFSVFLARLISPEEYGLIGMLTVLSGFAIVVGEAGLSSAVVYVEKADEDTYSTAFWIQFGINLAFSALFLFGARWIAEFYESDLLAPLTQLMSCIFVLQSVGQIQNAILARQMNFKAIAIAAYAGALVSSIVALALALLDFGVYALAWQAIANAIVVLVVTTIYSRWVPRLRFSLPVAREMISYGSYLLLDNGINYWLRNGDNLVIGKVLGAYPLGIYNRAYTLMLLPLQNIRAVVGQVMFPTLSRIRGDMNEFRRLYCNSIRLIALIAFPLMAGLSILAYPVLLLMYGPRWVEAAPILQILSLVGALQCVISPVGWIYQSLGRSKLQFYVTVGLVPLFITVIWVGIQYGIIGVSLGYAFWAVVSAVANIIVAGSLIGIGLGAYLELVATKAAATFAMTIVVANTHSPIEGAVGVIGGLVLSAALGATVYAGALVAMRDADFVGLVVTLRSRLVRPAANRKSVR